MTKQDIKDFLAFRSKFTKREWNSLMQTIHFKENERNVERKCRLFA